MSANTDQATIALRKYYAAIPSGSNPFASFDELVRFVSVDQHLLKNYSEIEPTNFMEDFGASVRYLNSSSKLTSAMEKLASSTSKKAIPSPSAFYNSLSNQALSFTSADLLKSIRQGVAQTASTVGGVVSTGISLYLAYATIAFAVWYFAINKKSKAVK